MFPKEKYTYISTNGKKIIALSTYAGKPVRGIAKCSDLDEFDEEKGKELAAARCNLKVAEKRWKSANDAMAEALDVCSIADKMYDKATSYYNDATRDLTIARKELEALLKNM